jgi:hypothetical protein
MFPLSDQVLFWDIQKSHGAKSGEYRCFCMCGILCLPKNVAQAEKSALVRRRCGFASSLTTSFLVASHVLRSGDTAELVNT